MPLITRNTSEFSISILKGSIQLVNNIPPKISNPYAGLWGTNYNIPGYQGNYSEAIQTNVWAVQNVIHVTRAPTYIERHRRHTGFQPFFAAAR